MVEQEREDELLDDPEDRQILMRRNLIERALLEGVEPGSRGGPRQALRHHAAGEVQILIFAQHIVELPGGAKR